MNPILLWTLGKFEFFLFLAFALMGTAVCSSNNQTMLRNGRKNFMETYRILNWRTSRLFLNFSTVCMNFGENKIENLWMIHKATAKSGVEHAERTTSFRSFSENSPYRSHSADNSQVILQKGRSCFSIASVDWKKSVNFSIHFFHKLYFPSRRYHSKTIRTKNTFARNVKISIFELRVKELDRQNSVVDVKKRSVILKVWENLNCCFFLLSIDWRQRLMNEARLAFLPSAQIEEFTTSRQNFCFSWTLRRYIERNVRRTFSGQKLSHHSKPHRLQVLFDFELCAVKKSSVQYEAFFDHSIFIAHCWNFLVRIGNVIWRIFDLT